MPLLMSSVIKQSLGASDLWPENGWMARGAKVTGVCSAWCIAGILESGLGVFCASVSVLRQISHLNEKISFYHATVDFRMA